MNRNMLKYIAVVAMIIDHCALVFVGMDKPLGVAMRVVGRLTAPIMCYFLVEGFLHTRSKKKYGLRLFAFALISQIPYIYLVKGYFCVMKLNMIFTLFFCFMILLCIEKIASISLKFICVLGFCYICYYCDWGTIAPLWILVFYIFKDDRKKMATFYVATCIFWVVRSCSVAVSGGDMWHSGLWQAGSFMALPVIMAYNGENGKSSKFSKWFFYWFYPVHLMILGIIFRNVLPYI